MVNMMHSYSVEWSSKTKDWYENGMRPETNICEKTVISVATQVSYALIAVSSLVEFVVRTPFQLITALYLLYQEYILQLPPPVPRMVIIDGVNRLVDDRVAEAIFTAVVMPLGNLGLCAGCLLAQVTNPIFTLYIILQSCYENCCGAEA